MIDSEFPVVTAKPGAAGGTGIPSAVESENGAQATDPEKEKFDDTLLSRISDLTQADMSPVEGGIEAAGEALVDGKELPPLPTLALTAETESTIADEFDAALLLDEESDKIIAAAPVILSDQLEQQRLLQQKTTAFVKQTNRDEQFARPTPDNIKAEALLAARADDAVLKPDFSARHFELMSSGTPLVERSSESATLASIAATTKTPVLESASQAASPPRLSIGVPVQQAQWADNLAGRVTFMLMNNQQSAQISLNPAELGPIEVKVNFQSDQANVNFYAHNASVRDAIEEAFPRLREMLNENGLNLGQSSVSDQSLSEKQGQDDPTLADRFHYPFTEDVESMEPGIGEVVRIKLGLVDHFV